MSATPDRPANALAREKSPYLLQHAHNPVDWLPWGEEAFARARAKDRPIFLSIGYATCHWCHVMERESFENEAVAALLNAHFVPVKVDREERPDVDRLYMAAAQAMRVGGGWPLNVFLTPDLEPFFGGTYFPPESRGRHIGMSELLPRVDEAWRERRDELVAGGARVIELLGSLDDPGDTPAPDAGSLARDALAALERGFDTAEGGFGGAPKFPSPGNLAFLLRAAPDDPEARDRARAMAFRQLDAMRAGGIHDHLGGGFHRYTTDRAWLVPHFEKMLYDQALLADAYLDAVELGGDSAYAGVARGIFAYLRRDLTAPGGAFCSAEDADSEGEEGRFYVWTPAQLGEALGAADAKLAAHRWGVTPQGNFEHGTSILHDAHSLARTAAAFGLEPADAERRLESVRETLLAARARRPRPLLDDKVIASWNGLAIAAMARGARVLGDPSLAADAARAATFVWERLRDPASGVLWRRWRDGEAAAAGQLDDHAAMARGMLELYGTTFDPVWLERAALLARVMLERFWDDALGAFRDSPAGDASVRVRMIDGHDGAEPAGNSLAVLVLLRLAALLGDPDWDVRARRALDYHARRMAGSAWAMPYLLVAVALAARPPRHIVIAGEPSPEREEMLAVVRGRFRPFDEVLVADEATRAALAKVAPFTAALRPIDDAPTAYVCVDRACRLPVTDPAALAAQLDEPAPAGAATERK
jgi:uncharacterized protein YyaL (SSP411 family)